MTTKLWVVSAPNGADISAFETVRNALAARHSLCDAFHLRLPNFRAGTLDSLIVVSDSIARDEKNLEATVERVLRQYRELITSDAPAPLVDGVDAFEYATDFEWDEAKFASSDSLGDLRKAIIDQVSRIEEDMKIRGNDYNSTKQALTVIARRSQGNLMARGLGSIIDADDVVESEHMTTAFVVFPSYMQEEFLKIYESLAELVVPRSARRIEVDGEYALYGVTVFKKCLEKFKSACRDKRFTVRDFKYDPDAAVQSADEEAKLKEDAARQHDMFTKWAETAYAEVFIAMVHLKAVRVFVESVLRYGLPVNFEVAILQPKSKSDSRLRSALNEMFAHLGGSWAVTGDEDVTGIPGIVSDRDFYPYVYLEIPVPRLR